VGASRSTGSPCDFYFATRPTVTSAWGALSPITELNTAGEDSDPSITADGLELYFSSDGRAGTGMDDIYVATRTCM